jgi:hypothetical protein
MDDQRPEGSRYPDLDEIEQADHEQLARWMRFLPSPGTFAIDLDRSEFERGLRWESTRLNRIIERFHDAGGWNSQLSKKVGW